MSPDDESPHAVSPEPAPEERSRTVPGAYEGLAQLSLDGMTVDVQVTLRSVFQPIDGLTHWYGRVQTDPRIEALVRSGGQAVLRTANGEATGRLSDVDPWGRYRVSGTGRPPF